MISPLHNILLHSFYSIDSELFTNLINFYSLSKEFILKIFINMSMNLLLI